MSSIQKFYLYKIFTKVLFIGPMITIFVQNNGLSFRDFMSLQVIYSITIILFEIPSGIFADLFGKRKSLIFGGVIYSISCFVYASGSFFTHFAIAEIGWGIAMSFVSGADTAFLYDALKDINKEQIYKKILRKANAIANIATVMSGIVGSFLASFAGLRFTFLINIIPFLLAVWIAISMKEPIFKKKRECTEKLNYYSHIKRNIIFVSKLKHVKWLLIYNSIVGTFIAIAIWFYQPYMVFIGVNISSFGLIYAFFVGANIISSKFARHIEERLGRKKSFIAMALFLGLPFILMGSFSFSAALIFIVIQEISVGLGKPILEHYMNSNIELSQKATIISFQKFVTRVIFIPNALFVGWLSELYGLQMAMMLSGIIVIAALLSIVCFKKSFLEFSPVCKLNK